MTIVSKNVLPPAKNYQIFMSIAGEPYTETLSRVSFISSLSSAYQTVILELSIETKTVILDKIYGQNPIRLKIQTIGMDEVAKTDIDINLIFDRMANELPSTDSIENNTEREQSTIPIITVIKESYQTMTTLVNKVYGVTEEPKNCQEIIEDLVSIVGANIEYDTNKINSEKISQVCIAPNTLYNALNYLNTSFGCYQGLYTSFCHYDNTVRVMNLTDKITKSNTISLHQLSTNSDNQDVFDKSLDGKNFYFESNIQYDDTSNARLSSIGKQINYIVTPNNSLYYTISKDMSDFSGEVGLIDKNKDLNFDEQVNRTRYFTHHTGNNYEEFFMQSEISKQIFNLSSVFVNLTGNMQIENLMNVGDCVKLNTSSLDYVDLSGKYILYSSKIDWIKGSNWETNVEIELVRTNKSL